MILITGGIYQGKLDFAKENFAVEDDDIFFCKDYLSIEDKRCICNIENLVKSYVEAGKSEDELRQYIDSLNLRDKIIIANDISQGIVPMKRQERQWRDWSGRLLVDLAKEAQEVYRVLCGLAHKFK